MDMRWPISAKGVLVRDGRALLMLNERAEWELPGGHVEEGESPEQAVVRECAEETGLRVAVDRVVDAAFFSPIAGGAQVLLLFYRIVEQEDLSLNPVLSDEHGQYTWAPLEDLPDNLPQVYRRAVEEAGAGGLAGDVLAHLSSRLVRDHGQRPFKLHTPSAVWPEIGVQGPPRASAVSGGGEDASGEIGQLVRSFQSRTFTPVEMVEDRIERALDWQLRIPIFVQMTAEAALAEAKRSEERYRQRRTLSSLDGILVGLKDLIDLKGRPTTAGSRAVASESAVADAEVVGRMKSQGVNVDLGKLNLHEYAYGPTGNSSAFGPVGNPFDVGRMAGGSSSGSAAAVATGIMSAALGTDTGGSVRIPAAFCGISGLKPTYGRVPTGGVVPLSWSLDHVGPMARRVIDVKAVWRALIGTPDQARPVNSLRVYWPQSSQTECYDAALQAYVAEGIQQIVDAFAGQVERGPLMDLELIWLAQSIVIGSESLAYHYESLARRRGQYQRDVADRLVRGGAHLAAEYLSALRYRQEAFRRWDAWFEAFDVIILPTVPVVAPALHTQAVPSPHQPYEEDVRAVLTRFTAPFNFLGLPALSIPWGLLKGLPVGIQLVGRRGDDDTLLALGEAIQDRFPESVPVVPA